MATTLALQALRAEASMQADIAESMRADVRAAETAAAAITDADSIEAGLAWARAGSLRYAMDAAIEAMRSAQRAARDIEDPDGLRTEAV